ATDYSEQKEILDALHSKRGEDVFVASYSAMQKKAGGQVMSFCVWSDNVDSMLPCTDEVLFFRQTSEDKGETLATGNGDRVRQVVGGLMTPLNLWPVRYRVNKFPTASQLAEIGPAA